MKSIILAIVAIALFIPTVAMSAVPVCHWNHSRHGGINYYVQVCTVAKVKHHRNSRWYQAGPNNSVKPHIG
jgi:uncharacterized protein YxeA